MKKELDYFTIEGCYGGNQDWFTNLVMHMGGCAAATACDSCIYFGLQNEKMKPLYPFNIECLTKEDYKAFSQVMKPYLKPRAGGVRKLSWFVEGLGRYIQDVNEAKHTDIYIRMEEFCGDHTWQEAAIFIKEQLGSGHSCTVPAFAAIRTKPTKTISGIGSCLPDTKKKMEKCTSKQQLMGKATPSNLKTSGTPAAKKKEASYASHHTTIN